MIVKLTKAFYGCIESAKLWYNHIKSHLESDGYVQNPIDICDFNKTVDRVQCTICIHVDDLLITCVDESIMEATLKEILRVYKQVFFVTDRVKAGEIRVEYIHTDEMIADILTKPLQGEKFRNLRAALLNWDKSSP